MLEPFLTGCSWRTGDAGTSETNQSGHQGDRAACATAYSQEGPKMNQDFVLEKLSLLLGWDNETARVEFAWLRLMSRMKYDDYQEFLAGNRFIESLADWLQQFRAHEREHAYRFIRSRLVFFSAGEMRHLVELFYPDTVERLLLAHAAQLAGIPRYQVWANRDASELYRKLLRKSIFIELSDGARIDVFRRANEGRISNEQVVTAPRINKAKWDEMLRELRKDLAESNARFAFIFLVDDFTGSGTTLLRKEDEQWKGKLQKCWDDLEDVLSTHFEPDWTMVVHHYVATSQAATAINERDSLKRSESETGKWFERVELTWGTVLPPGFKVMPADEPEFARLVATYYDDSIETRHMKVGGEDGRWGFGACGLPLVLEQNTPNNSIALLWAETSGGTDTHAMRPLFRRRQRHV